MAKTPTTVTIRGRLSFPNFDYARAVDRNKKSQFPKADEADVTPDFNLLLERPMLDKFLAFVKDEFLPYCVEQEKQGQKRNALTQAQADKILKILDAEDWESQPPYIPIKPINEKTASLAPEALVSLKVVGNRGTDIVQQAIVQDESELSVPDPDRVDYPAILPIGQTVHSLYGGCNAAATLNLYSFISGKLPGFSASASVCVFHSDNDRFGGGVAVDEEEMFLD